MIIYPMRHYLTLLFFVAVCLTACGPKPQYKTAQGKKKLKHYNALQYGGTTTSQMKRR
jgi:hypothetical protein